jgi:hypothetical protein
MRHGEGGYETAKGNYYHKIIHQHLYRDHHPRIAFATVLTVAVIERSLLYLLSDVEERMDLARSADRDSGSA